MQLKYKLSVVAATFLASSLTAEDYVRVQYLQYDESSNRISVKAPSLEVNKEFGVDYSLNIKAVKDGVSGATPIYHDTSSGASAFSRSKNTSVNNIKKSNVKMTESRAYTAASLVTRFENRQELTTSFSRSYESDYASNNLSADYLFYENQSKNRSYNIGFAYQKNQILIKDCTLNSQCDTQSSASEKKDASLYTIESGVTQIIDKTSLAKFSLFYSSEDGYLSNPYYNVVRNNNGTTADVVAEIRPDTRVSYGFNLKYFKSISKDLTLKTKYKFYLDDWDINSHTIDINSYYNLSTNLIFGLGLRYYTQSEANFYNKSSSYFTSQKYATHDDRLSDMNSTTLKSSLDYKLNKSLSLDVGINSYKQSTGLSAMYYSLGVKYKF